jgi:hypothetical protein
MKISRICKEKIANTALRITWILFLISVSDLTHAADEFNFISDTKPLASSTQLNSFITIYPDTKPALTSDPSNPKVQALLWDKSYIGFEVHESWQGQDNLVFDFFNPSETSLDINLEIKDRASKDYWTRVNNPLSIPSGSSQIRVPLALYVGEKARPGRALDLTGIRSVILARPAGSEGKSLYLRGIGLQKTTNAESLGLRAYDFGSDESPVFTGFRAWTAKMNYSTERGFGLKDASIWQPYKWANDGFQPDSLYRDSLLISKGEAWIDLPNGKYQVVMNIDHPGGYWGEYPVYHKRKAWAQNQLVVDESMNRDQAADRYFHFLKEDDHFDEDVFEKYDPVLFHEKTFNVEVHDGHLRLRFEGDNCLLEPCFGLALSSLIIIPEQKKSLGQKFLEWVRRTRKAEFEQDFQKILAPLPASDLKLSDKTSFYLFSYPLMNELAENQIPTQAQVNSRPPLRIAHGQKAISSFAILSNENSAEPYVISLSKQSAKEWTGRSIQIGLVSRRLMRLTPSGHRYTVGEKFIAALKPFQLSKGRTQRVWYKVSLASKEILPKFLEFTVQTGKSVQNFKVPIQTLNFDLPELDLPVGPFESTVREAWWYESETEYRRDRLRQLSLEKMRDIGLNSFSFSPHLTLTNDDQGQPVLGGLDLTRKIMKSARSLGFSQITAYNDIISGHDLCFDSFSDKDLKFLTHQLKSLSEKENWLPVTILACDEPIGDNISKAVSRMQSLRQASDSRVAYSAAFSIRANPEAELKKLWQTVATPYLNLFDLENLKTSQHPWVYYNSASRSSFGFGLFQLKEKTALKGRIAWTWNQNASNPFYALDSREDDYGWVSSTREGNLLPTVFLDRHVLEGINDYRYARLLKQTILKRARTDSLRLEGQKILDKILTSQNETSREPVPGDTSNQGVEEESLRSRIVDWLVKTQSETITKEKIK